MDEPIIDLQSDHFFMGEALRQAVRAGEAGEVPVGAVVVREGRIIARAYNQVELLKDATAQALAAGTGRTIWWSPGPRTPSPWSI